MKKLFDLMLKHNTQGNFDQMDARDQVLSMKETVLGVDGMMRKFPFHTPLLISALNDDKINKLCDDFVEGVHMGMFDAHDVSNPTHPFLYKKYGTLIRMGLIDLLVQVKIEITAYVCEDVQA